jgi:hypothetical protein
MKVVLSCGFFTILFFVSLSVLAAEPFVPAAIKEQVKQFLLQKNGEASRFRIERGVEQAARFWRAEDGTPQEFEKFCREQFIGSPEMLDTVFQRLELFDEALTGHYTEMQRDLIRPLDLDWGEILPIDMAIGEFNPSAHLTDDLFANKLAFIVVLNFPHYSLEEKTKLGPGWSRKEWAYARVGDQFTSRVPAEIQQQVSKTMTQADVYISEYNIFMGKVADADGRTYFPENLKLISHWGLRDELKARYKDPEGLKKQRLIYEIMQRIITQQIPAEVINSSAFLWEPGTNKILKDGKEAAFTPEPDSRYRTFLSVKQAMALQDPYYPALPTHIKRAFESQREIPEAEVEAMFTAVLSSPQARETGKLIRKRLGRPLEPFDIWYNGFSGKRPVPEEELDRIVAEKYPTVEAFQKDIPNILVKLGFSKDRAQYIASRIQVDPARGSGHAAGAEMKSAISRLRTRVPKGGMNYKGYNIAIHELGHSVEQTLSLQEMDYYSLHGVPNTAFTEAFAFVFQTRDQELLGIGSEDREARMLDTLNTFWAAYEIMGVALVDMKAWHWMYDHPDATPAQLKEAVIGIAKEVWNKYYADIFGVKDQPILAVYSHMIDSALYLPDYPIGHLISFQMEKYMEGKSLGTEMERMCKAGIIIPQLWMQNAVGSGISTEPLLKATDEALQALKK